jgi:hypothetical protein
MLERICAARAAGRTWIQIEHESAHWKEWDELPVPVKKLFAAEVRAEPQIPRCLRHDKSEAEQGDTGLETANSKPETAVVYRLPHSSLQRWYDLRIKQASREKEERTAAAHAAAEQLASRDFTDLTAAVKNALGETVFKLLLADSDPRAQIAALTSLARLLLQMDRNQISRERLQIERTRLRLLARKLEPEKARSAQKRKGRKKEATGNSVTPEEIDRIRSRVFGLPPVTIPEPSHPGQSTAGLPGAHEPPPPSDDGGVAAEPELPSPHPANRDQTALAGEPGFSGTAQDLVQDFGALSRQDLQPGARPIPPHPASNQRTRLRQRVPSSLVLSRFAGWGGKAVNPVSPGLPGHRRCRTTQPSDPRALAAHDGLRLALPREWRSPEAHQLIDNQRVSPESSAAP